MNEISSVSAPRAAAVAVVSEQTIASLQSQMLRFSPVTGGGPVSADYKALEYAIETGNVSAAQVALAKLRRDSQIPNSIIAPSGNNSAGPSIAGVAEHGGTASVETSHVIDTTA